MSSSKYSTDEENFSQNDEVIEPFDDDHDHSDAESKSEGEEIGKFVTTKRFHEFCKVNECANRRSSVSGENSIRALVTLS